VLFDTLCVFFPLFFLISWFEAAIYANKDVYIIVFMHDVMYDDD